MANLIMIPAAKNLEKGDLLMCIRTSKKYGHKKGSLGYCHDPFWFNIRKKYWQPQYLYVTSKDPINVGDWCMFYGQLSKVLEISGKTAKIETTTITSKSDADFINSVKGKVVIKAGDFGKMIHSFSVESLPKVIASTDPSLGLILMDESIIHLYISSHLVGSPITEIGIDSKQNFKIDVQL